MNITNCPCWRDYQCTENSLIRQRCEENEKCLLKQIFSLAKNNKSKIILDLLDIEENER